MSKAVRFHRLGGPEVLQLEDIDVPAPGPDEVQIRAQAFGLNRAESLFRSGAYIETPDLPSGLGLEAAGLVERLGPDVSGVSAGDRVAVIPPISMRLRPVQAELINVPADFVVAIPETQSFAAAAATWMAYLTAYGALFEVAKVARHDHVVISAASSSVGLAAIQLANLAGAVPIALTRSDRKREALLAAGARHVVSLDLGDVAETLRALAGPAGPRVAFDAVGGKLLPILIAASAVGGIIVTYGALDADPSALPPAVLLAKSLTVRGYLVHELVRDPAALARAKALILAHLASGRLQPTIARTFPLAEIAAAYRCLEGNAQIGKVVVTL
ncbi:MAG: zinc-dependent alcohol dehydrogenase family protein [Caulobacterales bacterium]|nr:zinc-dependent alcohol dehydrogenase family protein [Caulobacterales bacterium]